jgi:branched-chain amino acid transport system permease protein
VSYRVVAISITLGALLLVPIITAALSEPFYLTLTARIMIFALAAVGVNLVLSFAGLASLGHAAFFGLGAYIVGISISAGFLDGFAHLAMVLGATAVVALLAGVLCLRTSGLSFIMITLAFGQLLYFSGVGLKEYGGDDGFSYRGNSDFGTWLPLSNPTVLYYLIWVVLALVLILTWLLWQSKFGLALRGIKSNERRMTALGMHTYRYKLFAFVVSAEICAIAGFLLANLARFVSPAYMSWERSGDLLIMCLVGGVPNVFGPVFGAIVFLLLEEILASVTERWHLIFGPLLILLVLYANGGLTGVVTALHRRFARPGSAQ